MLKLKLQYFGHWCEELTHLKRPWCWERLKVGGEGDNRGWDGWMASLTQWTWVWETPGVGDGQRGQACCGSWGRKESDTTERLNCVSIFKSRDITLPTNVCLVKAMVFPVVMYGYENWTIKKAEHWIIDGFELWCWRRLLRVLWTTRRSSQSFLKEISLEYTLEGLVLKLKL